MQIIELSTALCLLLLASIWDIRHRRIPNAAVLPATVAGTIWTALFHTGALPLTLLTLLLLFGIGALHVMGPGDIKLVMALTALCGPVAALISSGTAALLVVCIQFLLYPNDTYCDMKNAFTVIVCGNLKIINQKGRRVPFAPYILAGFIYYTAFRLLN